LNAETAIRMMSMTMAPRRKAPGMATSVPPGHVKTTLVLPAGLWARAKKRAINDGTDLRSLLIQGLETVLKRRR